MMPKVRLDALLVERGLAGSRERAKRMIMAGEVLVDEQKIDKAGTMVKQEAAVRLLGHDLPYVSRGGLKLEKAIREFGVQLQGKTAADIGASTGGFTDCMLQNGAAKVYAIDVGYGQLAWKLRTDARVVNMERTNIRYVTPEDLGTALDFASIDVAFISLDKVLLAAALSGWGSVGAHQAAVRGGARARGEEGRRARSRRSRRRHPQCGGARALPRLRHESADVLSRQGTRGEYRVLDLADEGRRGSRWGPR